MPHSGRLNAEPSAGFQPRAPTIVEVLTEGRWSIKPRVSLSLTPAEGALVLVPRLTGLKEKMYSSQLHYIPLALPFFLFFAGLLLFLVVLIQIHVLQYAYSKLGLSAGAALLLLLASLIGSYFNIPITELPEREVRSGQVIDFFGMRYVVPLVTDWPRTVIAVNVGGAVIPSLLSLYLLLKSWIWSSAAVATLVVTVACYLLAQPSPESELLCRFSSRRSLPQWRPYLWHASTLRQSLMSAELWEHSLERICSILVGFRDWELPLSRLEEPALLTGYF